VIRNRAKVRRPAQPSLVPLRVAAPRKRTVDAAIRRAARRFEHVFAVLAIIVLAGAASALARVVIGSSSEEGEDPVTRALTLLTFGFSGLLCLVNFKRVAAAVGRNPVPALLVLLAFVSIYWSISPGETLARSIGLTGTTLTGLFLAVRFDRAKLVELVGWGFGIAAVASFFTAVAMPEIGIQWSPEGDQWRGVFVHKNTMARAMALTIVVLVLNAYHRKRVPRWTLLAVAATGGLLLLRTESATGVVVTVVLLALIPGLIALRGAPALAVPVGLAGVVLVIVAGNLIAANTDEILIALGRDPSLTGRTPLWEATSYYVADRPWLGHGFAAFWEEGSVTKMEIRHAVQWNAPHSHNGFRDLTLDLGYVGLGIFAVGFLVAVVQAFATLRRDEGAAALWPVVFLAFLVLYNLSESTLLRASSVFWALFVATACSPSDRRKRRRGGFGGRRALGPAPLPAGFRVPGTVVPR
jgi:exopolysaccharide production protein ExoQ